MANETPVGTESHGESEPFCTVFRMAVSHSIDTPREQDFVDSWSRACPDKVVRGLSRMFIIRNPQPFRPPVEGTMSGRASTLTASFLLKAYEI